MVKRIFGGLGFLIVAIIPLLKGGVYLNILLTALASIAMYEIINTTYKKINIPLFISMILYFIGVFFFDLETIELSKLFIIFVFILAVLDKDFKLDAAGMCIVIGVILASAMTFLRDSYGFKGSNFTCLYLVVAPCLTDIGAYFAGSLFGKHKLIERVSPKKTIEGAIGGWILGFASSFAMYYFVSMKVELEYTRTLWLLLSLSIPVISQFGDLAFSLIKRYFGIKDFGNIIPGHGGILDRLDSIAFVVLYFSAVVTLLG